MQDPIFSHNVSSKRFLLENSQKKFPPKEKIWPEDRPINPILKRELHKKYNRARHPKNFCRNTNRESN